MNFLLRDARPPDRDGILGLYARLRRPPRSALDLAEYLIGTALDGKIIGCAGVHHFDEGSYLFGLAVDRPHQRQGLGSALTLARLDRARHAGSRFAVVLAMFWNVRFFRHLGFRSIGRADLPSSVSRLDDFQNPTYRRSSVLIQELPT